MPLLLERPRASDIAVAVQTIASGWGGPNKSRRSLSLLTAFTEYPKLSNGSEKLRFDLLDPPHPLARESHFEKDHELTASPAGEAFFRDSNFVRIPQGWISAQRVIHLSFRSSGVLVDYARCANPPYGIYSKEIISLLVAQYKGKIRSLIAEFF